MQDLNKIDVYIITADEHARPVTPGTLYTCTMIVLLTERLPRRGVLLVALLFFLSGTFSLAHALAAFHTFPVAQVEWKSKLRQSSDKPDNILCSSLVEYYQYDTASFDGSITCNSVESAENKLERGLCYTSQLNNTL